jgi:hypothetical protein
MLLVSDVVKRKRIRKELYFRFCAAVSSQRNIELFQGNDVLYVIYVTQEHNVAENARSNGPFTRINKGKCST